MEPVYWAAQPIRVMQQKEQDFQAVTVCQVCDNCSLTAKSGTTAISPESSGGQPIKTVISIVKISVVFQNLSSYDASFVTRARRKRLPSSQQQNKINSQRIEANILEN